jgi:hypothetical protein
MYVYSWIIHLLFKMLFSIIIDLPNRVYWTNLERKENNPTDNFRISHVTCNNSESIRHIVWSHWNGHDMVWNVMASCIYSKLNSPGFSSMFLDFGRYNKTIISLLNNVYLKNFTHEVGYFSRAGDSGMCPMSVGWAGAILHIRPMRDVPCIEYSGADKWDNRSDCDTSTNFDIHASLGLLI